MIEIHQRQNGNWCYVDTAVNVGHKYTPMAAWVGQFRTREEAVLAVRAAAAELAAAKRRYKEMSGDVI